MRKLEILLWAVAVVLLSAYGWVWVDRHVYQAYRDWQFERALASQPAPADDLGGFTPAPGSRGKKKEPAARTRVPNEAVVGRIEIPRLGLRAMILEGTSDRALRRAVGHIEGTAMPGEAGNSGLAGHRDTFFMSLKSIRKDDTIRIRTLDSTHTYVVDSTKVVEPNDVHVLNATAEPTLTLVTCYPFNYVGAAPERFIVQARLISTPAPDGPRASAGSAVKSRAVAR
jgi:sortase A